MKKIVLYILLVFALSLSSCIQHKSFFDAHEGDIVDVALSLSVQGEAMQTKVHDNVDPEEEIRNFWLLQFDGVSGDAKLIGQPSYYADVQSSGVSVKLVESVAENRIVVIANTFDPMMIFPDESTYDELKKRWMQVEDDLSFMPFDGGEHYMIFSGSVTEIVEEGKPISCQLGRNVARVDITIINSSKNVSIHSWQLRSIPTVSYYLSEDLPAEFPPINDLSLIDYPLVTPDEPISPPQEGQEPTSTSFSFYLPVNKRGVVDGISDPKDKNSHIPSQACTYLQINASYDGDSPIQYTFYLGANLTDDFNILPNHLYSYEFNITKRGDAESDSRIKEFGLVDFTGSELANCYIINPPEMEGVQARYHIPIARVNEFWGAQGYEDDSHYALLENTNWEVRIISDNFNNETTQKLKLRKSNGVGSMISQTEPEYFAVSVEKGAVGSAVVALYANGQSSASWSWHLWITDYAPDKAIKLKPQPGVYAYTVEGNTVHRYAGSDWEGNNAPYADRFIMDRNLGAIAKIRPDGGSGKGSVYYVFGGKDPLFGGNVYSAKSSDDFKDQDAKASLYYSIWNPLTYFTGAWDAWSKNNEYNPSNTSSAETNEILWMDPWTDPQYTNPKYPQKSTVEKSIFDPCPPGYCVPEIVIWRDFRRQDQSAPTTNVTPAGTSVARPGFPSYGEQGLYYWPYPQSGEDKLPQELIYYPATGIRQPSSTPPSYMTMTTTVYSWTSKRANNAAGYALSANATSLSIGRSDLKMNLAQPVRCVTLKSATQNAE